MLPARVLFVNHTSTISGAEKVLIDIAAASNKPGAFLFEHGALSESLRSAGADVWHSRFGARLSKIKRDSSLTKALPSAGRMMALIAELTALARRYDVIYANSQKAFTLGAIASAIARRPLIWHLHDIISPPYFGASQRRLQVRLANRFAKQVIGPSQAVVAAFIAAGGNADIAKVVHNGFDVPAEGTSKAELRKALGLPSGPLIGVFSRLAPWKGQHVVLRAVARFNRVHCIIAGDALFGEDDYAKSLRALVSNLGISNRVFFLGHRADVPTLMRAVDVVVHPSVLPEPFATTLLEAMMVRVPIIATDTGGSAEALSDGEHGILVPPGDTAALVSALRDILSDPEGLAAKTEKAETWARQEYRVEKMRSSVAGLIESVARGGSA